MRVTRSFIRGMLEDPVGAAIVEAINRVGHVVGAKTVAEYVESQALLQRVRAEGVDYVQGNVLQKQRPWPLGQEALVR